MTEVRIDLGAVWRNLDRLSREVSPARVWAVVKADGYGHGAVPIARTLESHGALRGVSVARLEEALELRKGGYRGAILVLSPLGGRSDYVAAAAASVELVLSSTEQLRWAAEAARELKRPLPVHVELDTGMTRLGLPPREAREWILAPERLAGLELRGWLTHFARADELDAAATDAQLELFRASMAEIPAQLREGIEFHVANSAAALHWPSSRFDAVRVGLALYGVEPIPGRSPVALEPAMAVRSAVTQLHRVAPGRSVGYGGRWRAKRPSTLAIVPVGYADGYSWSLGNRAEALLAGRRVPVVGAVSMDLLALDATDLDVRVGSEVVLLGSQGRERITIWELADWAGTIPYELLCRLGRRLPRRYVERILGTRDDEAANVEQEVQSP